MTAARAMAGTAAKLLLLLALRLARGVEQSVDPDRNLLVRATRRLLPVTSGFRNGRWFAREDGRRHCRRDRLPVGAR